jgi:hypothetical protein
LALVLKNILAGQDVVIEEMMEMGALEVVNMLLDCNQENATNEALGALANIFCAEDEEIVERALKDLNRPKLVEELLFRSIQIEYQEEALRALSEVVKNHRSIAESVITGKGIPILLDILKQVR